MEAKALCDGNRIVVAAGSRPAGNPRLSPGGKTPFLDEPAFRFRVPVGLHSF